MSHLHVSLLLVGCEHLHKNMWSSTRQGTIASEEEDLPVSVEETFSGNYVVVFDPLDGSSNIDAGISTGLPAWDQQSLSESGLCRLCDRLLSRRCVNCGSAMTNIALQVLLVSYVDQAANNCLSQYHQTFSMGTTNLFWV